MHFLSLTDWPTYKKIDLIFPQYYVGHSNVQATIINSFQTGKGYGICTYYIMINILKENKDFSIFRYKMIKTCLCILLTMALNPYSSMCIAKRRGKNKATCFNDVCLQPGYSSDVAPSPPENQSLIIVKLEYALDNILSVDHDHNILGITLSLRQSWVDNRVFARDKSMLENSGWLAAPTRMGRNPETGIPEHIWMPKFYIYWLFEMVIKTNFQQQTLIWISKDREENTIINYDSHFDLYLKCPMKYNNYPFDEHECSVKLSSADLKADKLRFDMVRPARWGRLKNTLGQFDASIVNLTDSEYTDFWEGESWSISGFKVRLRRRYWKYVFSYYLTSGLFVVTSWVSFLVPVDDVNARMALLVTILLVLVTVYNSVIEMAPKAQEGPTALAVWMFCMLAFVFLAFLCHCIAMLWRKSRDRKKALAAKQRRKRLLPVSSMANTEFETKDYCSQSTAGETKKVTSSLKLKTFLRTAADNQNSHTVDFIILSLLLSILVVYIAIYCNIYS